MGRGLVQTADEPFALALKDELRLVAVALGLGRGGDRLDTAQLAHRPAADILFIAQLLRHTEIAQVAGAAFL